MQLNEVGMASFVSDVVTVLSTKGVRLVPEEIKKIKTHVFHPINLGPAQHWNISVLEGCSISIHMYISCLCSISW